MKSLKAMSPSTHKEMSATCDTPFWCWQCTASSQSSRPYFQSQRTTWCQDWRPVQSMSNADCPDEPEKSQHITLKTAPLLRSCKQNALKSWEKILWQKITLDALTGIIYTVCSSAMPLLIQPFARTDFTKRSFQCAKPSVWNSLLASVIGSVSLSVFKSGLKTFLFRRYF